MSYMAKKNKGDIVSVVDPDGNFLEETGSALVPDVVTEEDFPVETEETNKLREEIAGLTKAVNKSYFDLSRCVWLVNKNRYYRTWGFTRFEDWAEQEFGFQRRKAFNFVAFYEYCDGQLKEKLSAGKYTQVIAELEEVGWSKALEIANAKIITSENVDEVMAEAQESSVVELATKIKLLKATEEQAADDNNGVTENTMKRVKRAFRLTTAQDEIVLAALEKARAAINRPNVGDEFALEYICADFEANASTDISYTLSNLERSLGIQIVAFKDDAEGTEVCFGGETLNRLVAAE
jgi:hypothetical protein